jgi:hypothetical protein
MYSPLISPGDMQALKAEEVCYKNMNARQEINILITNDKLCIMQQVYMAVLDP